MNDNSDRMLKETSLTSIGTLLRFVGSDHTSDICFKVMGLLKSTAPSNLIFKRIYINLWKILIMTCNPQALGPLLSVIFVALEPYLEEFPEKVEAICGDYILERNQNILSTHISDLFFIGRTKYPIEIRQRIQTQILSQALTDGNDFETNLKRLVRHMRSENADSDVKNYCLQYLHDYSKQNRDDINHLIWTPEVERDVTIGDLLSILLDCCHNMKNKSLLIQAAICLGDLGALMPDIPINSETQIENLGFTVHSDIFALHILNLFLKDYKDLHQSEQMEFISLGIQEVLKDRSMTPNHNVYQELSRINQQLIKPFFNSRYFAKPHTVSADKNVFWQKAADSGSWAEMFATLLIEKIKHPKTSSLLSFVIRR